MTNEPGLLDEILGDLKGDPDYVAESMSLQFVEDALALMESQGMNKARLADAMHVSRAYVTKVFNAPPNLTLRTIAQLALAVGARPTLRLDPIVAPARRIDPFAMNAGLIPSYTLTTVAVGSPLAATVTMELAAGALGPPQSPMVRMVFPALPLTTENSWNFLPNSRSTSPKSAGSLPRASAGSTPNTSTTVSTTTAPSMAA